MSERLPRLTLKKAEERIRQLECEKSVLEARIARLELLKGRKP